MSIYLIGEVEWISKSEYSIVQMMINHDSLIHRNNKFPQSFWNFHFFEFLKVADNLERVNLLLKNDSFSGPPP